MKLKKFAVGALDTNCYFLIDEPTKQAVVVDPGDNAELILKKLKSLGLTCAVILLTHGHYDHTMALTDVRAQTGAPVYIHAADADMLNDPSLSQAKFLGGSGEPVRPPEHLVADGDKITLGETVIEVMHTPGHTPGSVCYFIRDDRDNYLISGDTLFRGGIGRHDLAGGNYKALMASLRKIASLPEEWLVYPGHGASTTLSSERENNMYMF